MYCGSSMGNLPCSVVLQTCYWNRRLRTDSRFKASQVCKLLCCVLSGISTTTLPLVSPPQHFHWYLHHNTSTGISTTTLPLVSPPQHFHWYLHHNTSTAHMNTFTHSETSDSGLSQKGHRIINLSTKDTTFFYSPSVILQYILILPRRKTSLQRTNQLNLCCPQSVL